MLRLFLAIPLPTEVKKEIGREIVKAKDSLTDWKISWVSPENLHVTLIFLGWVSEEKIELLKQEASGAVSNFSPFSVSTGLVSANRHPIWFEIEKGGKELDQLYQRLGEKLSIKGSFLEKRPFQPHLTIGRVKKRGKVPLPQSKGSFQWKANRVVLYQSKLKRSGAIYIELASFPLRRA